ncbi:MAG: antibiotic biosynthesis monooxygenase family protein [Pseudomonadota bacterium]
MTVKILIKRTVPEGRAPELIALLKKMRILTTNQPGYISGETLRRVDSPNENLVISTWQSVDAWRAWVVSGERKAVQEKIDTLLGANTEYELYESI